MGLFPRPGPRCRRFAPHAGGLSMAHYVFRLPDIGEGIVEAEITAWHVQPGEWLEEDQPMVDVMTDKATVEMTAPVSGRISALHGEIGQKVAIGAPLVELELEGMAPASAPPAKVPPNSAPLASPATRQRARELGIALELRPWYRPGGADYRRRPRKFHCACGTQQARHRGCAHPAETEAVVERLVRHLAPLLDTSSDMDELDPAGPADMALVRLTASEALLRLARLHDARIHPEVYMSLALTMQVGENQDLCLLTT